MMKKVKEQIKDYFDDHYKYFNCYPMECIIYDENEETTYSFEECMKLIRKELA